MKVESAAITAFEEEIRQIQEAAVEVALRDYIGHAKKRASIEAKRAVSEAFQLLLAEQARKVARAALGESGFASKISTILAQHITVAVLEETVANALGEEREWGKWQFHESIRDAIFEVIDDMKQRKTR